MVLGRSKLDDSLAPATIGALLMMAVPIYVATDIFGMRPDLGVRIPTPFLYAVGLLADLHLEVVAGILAIAWLLAPLFVFLLWNARTSIDLRRQRRAVLLTAIGVTANAAWMLAAALGAPWGVGPEDRMKLVRPAVVGT